jgi:thymidylate synthase (FAD)
MDDHAQEEIRLYAVAIGEQIAARWVPLVWEAFNEYRRKATRFSELELRILQALVEHREADAKRLAADAGLLEVDDKGALKRNRERDELTLKLRSVGAELPW